MNSFQAVVRFIAMGIPAGILVYGFALHFQQKKKIIWDVDRVESLLLGIAIGDAYGVPFETMTREVIATRLQQELEDPQNPYRKLTGHKNFQGRFQRGQWTDDTQLSLAMLQAITEAKGFDIKKIVEYHLKAFHENTFGWGGGTKSAIERLDSKNYTFETSGTPSSTGNGVVMKIAPLAYYYSRQSPMKYPDSKKMAEVELLTRMTHNNMQAVIAACFHCKMLEKLFRRVRFGDTTQLDTHASRQSFIEDALFCAIELEMKFDHKEKEEKHKAGDLLSQRLNMILQELIKTKGRGLTDEKLVEISKGGNHYVINSLSMVYGILAQSKLTFGSLLKAALIGGDTDTNASMVGCVVGALKGNRVFPRKYLQHLHKCKEIRVLATQFSKICNQDE